MKLSLLSSILFAQSVSAFTVQQNVGFFAMSLKSTANSNRNDVQQQKQQPKEVSVSRRNLFQKSAASAIALSTTMIGTMVSAPSPSNARLDPVDNPSLLPSTPDEVVIQTEKFLTSGQVKRMSDLIRSLEKETGFRLRVLCQNYPNTVSWYITNVSKNFNKHFFLIKIILQSHSLLNSLG